jgi:hypothetical protein
LSDYSNEVTVLAAETPATPAPPSTVVNGNFVEISWSAPDSRGSEITSYITSIRTSDGVTFMEDLTNCDGSDSAIVASTTCSVPISTLRASSFMLPWGSSIYAIVTAINLYGPSVKSSPGNGAVILTNPDTPVDLAEYTDGRNSQLKSLAI